jgi:hypothetical protein
MKLTNKFDLPDTFINYSKNNEYSPGSSDITATTMIDSPKINLLKRKHFSEMEEDISDRIMSLLGTAVHQILQDGAGEMDIVEERFYMDVGGTKLGGQIDLMTPVEGGYLIQDYKTTGAYSLQSNPDGKREWEEQLNIYAALAEENGVVAKGLEIVAIIRDWTASGKKRSKDYPEHPVVRIPIKMWDPLDRMKFIEKRISAHKQASEQTPCTPEERWARAPKFAVHKRARGSLSQRATRVFDNVNDAGSFVLSAQGDHEIVERPGSNIRCEGNYCGVADFCTQFQHTKGEL